MKSSQILLRTYVERTARVYCLCKNVLRMCRKEASPLNEPSPSKQTSNQTGWMMRSSCFFPSRCSPSSKSGHYDMKWTAVVNHRWHITTSIPVLHLWAAHRVTQTHALWEPDVKSQDKSKIPDCAERCGAAVGENGMWAPCISVTLWDLTSLHSEYDYEKKCCSSLYISVEDERSMKMSVQTVLSFPKSEFQQLNGSFNNAPLT